MKKIVLNTLLVLLSSIALTACSKKAKPVVNNQAMETPMAEAAAEKQSIEHVVTHFDFDKSDVRSQDEAALNDFVNAAPANSTVVVEGHCDERGTRDYNLSLGERRANAVKTYLKDNGMSSGDIQTISYGKEKPIDQGHNKEALAKNRRAEVILKNN